MRTIKNEQYKATPLSKNKFVDNKQFVNCIFEKCNLSDYRFTNCEFEDCIFTTCNFSYAFLALNKGYNSGKFVNCLFNNCNLKATSFRFPVIDNCEFRNCILNETNFDGSRFSNTKFIGTLDSCFFRGYSIYANRPLFSFSKFDPLKVPNKMMRVDFSEAKLIGVKFSNRIDLSNCIFPEGEEYIYIKDLKTTMNKALDRIKKEWSDGYEKETGIKLIQDLYYSKDMQEQPNSFLDLFVEKELDAREGNNLGDKLFMLIKSCNAKSS